MKVNHISSEFRVNMSDDLDYYINVISLEKMNFIKVSFYKKKGGELKEKISLQEVYDKLFKKEASKIIIAYDVANIIRNEFNIKV